MSNNISDISPMYFSILIVHMISSTKLWLPPGCVSWNHWLSMVLVEMLALYWQNVVRIFDEARYHTGWWQWLTINQSVPDSSHGSMEAVIWDDALSFRKPDCRFCSWHIPVFRSLDHHHLWQAGSLAKRGSTCQWFQSTMQRNLYFISSILHCSWLLKL